MKLLIFTCLLSLAMGREVFSYFTPTYGYYPATAVSYARTAAVLPLAYSRLVTAPGGQSSHVYHSVETPNSFQQQYRTDYKPLTYEFLY